MLTVGQRRFILEPPNLLRRFEPFTALQKASAVGVLPAHVECGFAQTPGDVWDKGGEESAFAQASLVAGR